VNQPTSVFPGYNINEKYWSVLFLFIRQLMVCHVQSPAYLFKYQPVRSFKPAFALRCDSYQGNPHTGEPRLDQGQA
jgi:hypothetical protein